MPAQHPSPQRDPRELKRYYLRDTTFRRVVTWTLRILFWLIADLKVEGAHNLPEHGPVVLAANHLTNFDVFPIQFALPRLIFFMAKAELHENKLLDAALRKLGSFPVYRGEQDEWAMSHARQVLEHNLVLGMFPEGKRSLGKGLRPAKSGVARVSWAVKSPIVPLAVDGTQRIFHRFPRRARVAIRVGVPIFPDGSLSPLELTDHVMFAIADLLPVELRGVYANRPVGLD